MRRLVICADGTWNKDEEQADGGGRTNVSLLKDRIPATDPFGTAQFVFYHAGVGTGNWWDRFAGGAFGSGISKNIKDCYADLVQHYQPGDEIFLFGFSRGAYTVRSLAGMVRNCGVLRRPAGTVPGVRLAEPERKAIEEAYAYYRDRDEKSHPSSPDAVAWRAQRAVDVPIKCLGVWDTVGSLGVPTSGPVGWISRQRHGFHDVKLSSQVQNAFHALAIDERRKPFAPTLWEVNENDPALASGTWRVEQRWFAGVHSNVGGGYPDRGLSNVALRWMVDRATQCGLFVEPAFVEEVHAGCDCKATLYDSYKPVFKALGAFEREIEMRRAKVKTFEDVDDTAAERCVAGLSTKYRPKNFLQWWDRYPKKWEKLQRPSD